MEHVFTLNECVEMAQSCTRAMANTNDWRLTTKGRRFKQVAQEMNEGKGYIIATENELRTMYPTLYRAYRSDVKDDQKIVWGISRGVPNRHGHYTPSFVPVR